MMRSGAFNHIHAGISRSLALFQAVSTAEMRRAFRVTKWQSILRHAWILDQLTPASRQVRLPRPPGLHEAAVSKMAMGFSLKPEAPVAWDARWSAWMDAYRPAVMQNIRMGAINESTIEDAMDEVDATRIGSPSTTLDKAMVRIFDFESQAAVAEGEDDVVEENDDLVQQEVWKTRGDKLVCDDCDANEGETAETADGDIPLHPNCNCFWEVVPKSYAQLLRSGDEDDRALARMMQARGLVDISLTVRNDDGVIAGKAVVDFDGWTEGQPMVVEGGT